MCSSVLDSDFIRDYGVLTTFDEVCEWLRRNCDTEKERLGTNVSYKRLANQKTS